MSAVEQVTDPVAFHAEGPVWSPSWGGLRWVDMLAGDVLTLRPDGSVDRLHVGEVAAFVRPRVGGGYVVGVERGLALADGPDDTPRRLPPMWTDRGIRMNEGGCDPQGRLYAGSMAYDQKPGGATLYRIDADLSVTTVLPHVTISNGLDFSPDGTLAYYNDSGVGRDPGVGRTDVFDVVDGELVNRRLFRESDGAPDGLTVDSAGNVWTALNGPGRVRCYSPSGELLADVDLPVRGATACTLGGEDLRDLYITTSPEGLDDPEPEAGSVLRIRVDVPGRPVLPFAG
jgi:sugar lactone lactonase YvrE